jgi:hypothetical protein
MSNAPRSIPELIDKLGGPSEFARIIQKTPSAASEMKRTRSIRVSYWPQIIAAAKREGIPGVTLESLARMNLGAPERVA